jgi:hypothetical protein
MTRKLSVLLILAFFVMSLGSAAFAAKATTAVQSKPSGLDVSASADIMAKHLTEAGVGAVTSGKPTSQPTAMGYYMQVLGQVIMGTTEFDWQSNDRQQREIAMGTDNRIHSVWINRALGGTDRSVNYSGFKLGSGIAPTDQAPISPIPGSGGYGAIAIDAGDTLAMATFHYTKTGSGTGWDTRSRIQIGRQAAILSSGFGPYDYPSDAKVMPKILDCQGIITGVLLPSRDTLEGGYIWPSIATDHDPVSGKTIAHVLAREYPILPTATDSSNIASLVYYKTLPDAAYPGTYTCGYLIDSVAGGINYDIAADPGSQKVAAVYLYPKVWIGPNFAGNNDVWYKESSDLGTTWGSRTRITDFTNADSVLGAGGTSYYFERGNEVSALYDANGYLHVLYSSSWTAPRSGYGLIIPGRLYHWSSQNPTCHVMLLDAYGTWGASAGYPPTGQNLLAKISLTQCTVGATNRLYAVYTIYPDSTGMIVNPGHFDRNYITNIRNGDIAVQASVDLSGSLWGPVVNVSNTRDSCIAEGCHSEQYTTTPPYVTDSLRIQYLLDLDAGSAVQGGTDETEGSFTDNPIVVKSWPCYAPATEAFIALDVASIDYPFHTTPGGTNHVDVTMTNTGNVAADYVRTVNYTNGSNWLSFANPANSSVPAGCVSKQDEVITATGPTSEGVYKAKIVWAYTGGKADTMPVELYNFTSWFMDQNPSIRTRTVAMVTNASSRVGSQRAGYQGFRYFSEGKDTSYVFDGSLLIGTSSSTISALVHCDSVGVRGNGDTAIGRLYALSEMVCDSTGVPGPNTGWDHNGYRHSSGKGCNRDSTISFDLDFYAPKFDDSSNFIIGKFSLYAGPKNAGVTTNNVTVCYGADLDVPDTNSSNLGDVDATLQMVYQTAKFAPNTNRFMALSGWREDNTAIAGGMVMDNRHWLYPHNGYENDSIWTRIQATTGYTPYGVDVVNDTAKDLNSMLVISKTATIKPKASGLFTFYVIFAGQPKVGGTLVGLKAEVCKGRAFIKNYFTPTISVCLSGCTSCGDANDDGGVDISDAVFLIAYIFSGGAAPHDCNYPQGMGDANADGGVDISDAVYLIAYIFSGGAAPHCQ